MLKTNKTTKTTKLMRLDELIEYVWLINFYPSKFINQESFEVLFDDTGGIKVQDDYVHNKNSFFKVEVEEPITKNTKFDLLIELYKDSDVCGGYDSLTYYDKTVNYILESSTNKHYPVEEIHALVNGKLELIWERKINDTKNIQNN